MDFTSRLLLLLLIVSFFISPVLFDIASSADLVGQTASAPRFSVSYTTDPMVIPADIFHTWTITVTDADGKPVNDADVTVEGGMPASGRSLRTQPRASRSFDDGKYLIEGVKFPVPGVWEMKFTIATNGTEETVVVTIQVR